jgi:hypothetical protein
MAKKKAKIAKKVGGKKVPKVVRQVGTYPAKPRPGLATRPAAHAAPAPTTATGVAATATPMTVMSATTGTSVMPLILAHGGWEISRSDPGQPPVPVAELEIVPATTGQFEKWFVLNGGTIPLPAPAPGSSYRFTPGAVQVMAPTQVRSVVTTPVSDLNLPLPPAALSMLQPSSTYILVYDDGTFDFLVTNATAQEYVISLGYHAYPTNAAFTLSLYMPATPALADFLRVWGQSGT